MSANGAKMDWLNGNENEGIEEEDEEAAAPAKKRRRGKNRKWVAEREFANREEAEAYVKNENTWAKHGGRFETAEGAKQQLRCNSMKGGSCPAAVQLLYQSGNDSVMLFRCDSDHDHAGTPSTRGIPMVVQNEIKRLYRDGVDKPRLISRALEIRLLPVPSANQLQNFMQRFRKEERGPSQLVLDQFQKWCDENSKFDPNEPHKGFVVNSEYGFGNDGFVWIQVFMSSVTLLRLVARSRCIQMDATYKLDREGYPCILVGTSDKDRRFHPAGICVVPGETSADFEFACRSLADGVKRVTQRTFSPDVLVADCADAITKGFQDVFGENTSRVYCWFHVCKAMDSHANHIGNRNVRAAIQQDYRELHRCQSEDVFNVAARLFLEKWRSVNDRHVATFLDYFNSNWCSGRKKWHAGVAPGYPATNNSLESTNRCIKDEFTKRTRLPLSHLLRLCVGDLLGAWSRERTAGHPQFKLFAHEPSRKTELWTKSWKWNAETDEIFWKPLGDTTRLFFIPAKHSAVEYTVRTIERYVRVISNLDWVRFDDYVRDRNSMWIVRVTGGLNGHGQVDWESGVHWENTTCNCPSFIREYQCKHSLGIAIRNHWCITPELAMSLPVGKPRTRGRPKKVTPALQKD